MMLCCALGSSCSSAREMCWSPLPPSSLGCASATSRHSRASWISIASSTLRTANVFEDSTPGAKYRDSAPPRKEGHSGNGLDENPRLERTVWSWYRFCEEKPLNSYRVRAPDVKRPRKKLIEEKA